MCAKKAGVLSILFDTATAFFAQRKRIVELAGKDPLPVIYYQLGFVDEGGLCPTGRTSMTSFGARLFTWTRS
jgi:hypothetical protein